MSFTVRLTREAEADLERLFDFILARELERGGAADFSLPERALEAIRAGLGTLRVMPFTCRKAGDSPFLRELVVPFGATGYVALFEVDDQRHVTVLAVRHQREDDYH